MFPNISQFNPKNEDDIAIDLQPGARLEVVDSGGSGNSIWHGSSRRWPATPGTATTQFSDIASAYSEGDYARISPLLNSTTRPRQIGNSWRHQMGGDIHHPIDDTVQANDLPARNRRSALVTATFFDEPASSSTTAEDLTAIRPTGGHSFPAAFGRHCTA